MFIEEKKKAKKTAEDEDYHPDAKIFKAVKPVISTKF